MRVEKFLELKSFDDFKNMGEKLIKMNDLPQWYWDKNQIPMSYHSIPSACKIINDYRMRYIEIEFDDDIVGFIFRVVQIIKTKQIKLFEVPFSLKNNNENIKIIIQHLYNTLGKQFIVFSNIYTCGELDLLNSNYYYDFLYFPTKFTNHYNGKHSFHRYKNFELTIYSKVDNTLKTDCLNVLKVWTQFKEVKEEVESPRAFNYALEHPNINTLYFIGKLNDIPCVCGIGIITKFGFYLMYHYSLNRAELLYKNIVLYSYRILGDILYKDYNISTVYVLGAHNKGSVYFKETNSTDKIKMYKLNIKKLLEELDNDSTNSNF